VRFALQRRNAPEVVEPQHLQTVQGVRPAVVGSPAVVVPGALCVTWRLCHEDGQ
jgi:hypothetical protein